MEPKTDGDKLQEWLKSILYGNYHEMLKRIEEECKVSKFTFENWRYSKCRIPELHKSKIEEIAGMKIF